jgi:DNA-binding HxlR family transcriptional regulator
MLILREFIMGVHRFDELQAQTGMSSHLLNTRLRRMEADGLVERRLYRERPPRYEYHLTPKGHELDPVLMMLRTWGRKWEGDCPPGEPAVRLTHKASGFELDDLWQIPGGGRGFTFGDVEPTVGPTFAAERARRREAFDAGERYVPPPLPLATAKAASKARAPAAKSRSASASAPSAAPARKKPAAR